MTLATLSDAIDWASSRWSNQRTVPTRLHTREEEGIGLGFTNSFRAALDAKPGLTEDMGGPTDCYHPLLMAGMSPRECPECHGLGVKEHRSSRYVYPMGLALHRLRNSPSSRRHPHPYAVVVVLASHSWLPQQTARALGLHWDLAEPLLLMALRKLHARYEEGPVKTTITSASVKWTDLSSSQQNAVIAGETAA